MHWHGFIAQGLIKAGNNNFQNDEADVSTKLTELGLNVSYQFSPNLRVAGQVVYLNGGNRYEEGMRLDYLFVDWTAFSNESWQVNAYIGRYKNQHWIYSSTRDVPLTRPSIILPQSVYFDGFRDVAVASDGLALKATHVSDIGDVEINWSLGASPITDKQTKQLLSDFAIGDTTQDYVHQASIFWQPFPSRWRYGVSLLESTFTYKDSQLDPFIDADVLIQRFMLNATYSGEKWQLASEVFQERLLLEGFFVPNFESDQLGQGAFLQFSYNLEPSLTLLTRYDYFVPNKDDRNGHLLANRPVLPIPSHFGFQKDWTVGITKELSNKMRVQLEYHRISGAARSTPAVIPDLELNKSKHWNIWAVQFMYWF